MPITPRTRRRHRAQQQARRVLCHCLTGRDNRTYDIARVSWLVGIVSLLLLELYQIIQQRVVSITDFSLAFGAICTGSSASVRIKSGAEPAAEPELLP